MKIRQLPNALTVLRLLLIVPFLIYLSHGEYRFTFYVFMLAGFTDGLDGWLARTFHWQSAFGSFADPLADKLLVASSFISLAIIDQLPWWLVVLVFMRDFTIVLGIFAWYKWVPVPLEYKPSKLSKLNTLMQLFLVTSCLFQLAYFQLHPHVIQIIIVLTSLTTLASYIDYVWTWGKKAYELTHFHQ